MHLLNKKSVSRAVSVALVSLLTAASSGELNTAFADQVNNADTISDVSTVQNGEAESDDYSDVSVESADVALKQAKAKNGFYMERGVWYFYQNGYKKKGLVKSYSRYYFMDNNYSMAANGWRKVNNQWYFFKANGVRANNESITLKGITYNFRDDGTYTTGNQPADVAASQSSASGTGYVKQIPALNMRSNPSMTGAVIGKVTGGTNLRILASSNGWLKVQANSKIGWVSAAYVVRTNDADAGSDIVELEQNQGQAYKTSSNTRVNTVLKTAYDQLGKAYGWGASGPNAFDCSGLTSFAFRSAGVNLPRVSRAQATVGRTVSFDSLQAGDLVFFSYGGTGTITHVGIYVGNGNYIHAPQPGDVVKISPLSQGGFVTAKRVIE